MNGKFIKRSVNKHLFHVLKTHLVIHYFASNREYDALVNSLHLAIFIGLINLELKSTIGTYKHTKVV